MEPGSLTNLNLATGAGGASDLKNLLPKRVAADISRYIVENSWGRMAFRENRDLVNAAGLSINYPTKEKSVAMRVSDIGEILVDQGEWGQVPSEAFLVGARAQWSYAAEEAKLFDLMAEEMMDALNAVIEFENQLVWDAISNDAHTDNTFSAETANEFSYNDLVTMRQKCQGPLDVVIIHPDQMADALKDDKFLRSDFITTIRTVEPETTIFETKLGITFIETEQATSGTVLGANSRRGGRFTIKTDVRRQRYDLGQSTGGVLAKGVTVWELIDAVVVRDKSVVKVENA